MKKIYIAGKLNDHAVGYIKNLHIMIKAANTIRKLGFSVFVPCLEVLCGMIDGEMEYEDYLLNNIPWMEQADAILVLPNWEGSKGVKYELECAAKCNIPIYYSVDDLINERISNENSLD